MNLGLISDNHELLSSFKIYFDNVYSYDNYTFNHIREKLDCLICDEKMIEIEQVISLRKQHETLKIFYIKNDVNYNLNHKEILEDNNIKLVPPKKTSTQIVTYICSNVLENVKVNNNIISFWGADSGVGTTSVTQAISEKLSSSISKTTKIGVLFLDGKDNYFKAKTQSLDSLFLSIKNRMLKINEILDIAVEEENYNNLFFIKGFENIRKRKYVQPEDIEYILQVIAKNFDIVIIDIPYYFDGSTIGAINGSGLLYLVTTQQAKVYSNFDSLKEQILNKLEIDNYRLVVNKYVDDFIPDSHRLSQMYNSNLVCILNYLEYGWDAEIQRKSLYSYDNKQYNEQIDVLAKSIAAELNININYDNSNDSFIKKLFRKKR